jgi:hypothetical protein
VPTHERLGPDDCENLQDRRKPAIQLDQEPAIIVREPDATMQPAPQDNQLMSKHRVLSFKPQLRLEWRGQDGQNETEQPDHSASLGDSITSSTRIRFSVATGRGNHRTLTVSSRKVDRGIVGRALQDLQGRGFNIIEAKDMLRNLRNRMVDPADREGEQAESSALENSLTVF